MDGTYTYDANGYLTKPEWEWGPKENTVLNILDLDTSERFSIRGTVERNEATDQIAFSPEGKNYEGVADYYDGICENGTVFEFLYDGDYCLAYFDDTDSMDDEALFSKHIDFMIEGMTLRAGQLEHLKSKDGWKIHGRDQ